MSCRCAKQVRHLDESWCTRVDRRRPCMSRRASELRGLRALARACMQVIEHSVGMSRRHNDRTARAALEATIAHLLVHPNIVTTYATHSGAVPVARLALPGSTTHDAPLSQTRDVTLLFQARSERRPLCLPLPSSPPPGFPDAV